MANKKTSQFTESYSASTESFLSIIENGVNLKITKENFLKTETGVTLSYKVFSGLLTQSGTDNPSIIQHEKTIIGSITATRVVTGIYNLIFENSFDPEKMNYRIETNNADGKFTMFIMDENTITITTRFVEDNLDDMLFLTPIEIKLYN